MGICTCNQEGVRYVNVVNLHMNLKLLSVESANASVCIVLL